MNNEDTIYSLNVEDLQVVAKVVYGKQLSDEQLEIISGKIGDYFTDWFEKVELAIDNSLDLRKLEEPDWDAYPY